MRALILAILLLAITIPAFGYGAPSYLPDGTHPRIILTPSLLTSLRAKAATNNPDWLALVAWCDAHLNDGGYDAGRIDWGGNNSFNSYRMGGYGKYIMNFSLAYQVLKDSNPTKAASYATYVRNILVDGIAKSLKAGEEDNGLVAIRAGETTDRTINAAEATALGITKAGYKLGYCLRYMASVPIAYDWIYPALSQADKDLLTGMMYRWYDWTRGVRSSYNNGVLVAGTRYHEDQNGDCTGTNNCTASSGASTSASSYGTMAGNFMGGATYFMALATVATYGDNADAPAYLSAFKTLLTSTVIDQLESNLKHSGGDSVEGWNYGGGYVYTLQGLYGYYTATGDPAVTAMTWPAALVDAMAHRLEGNMLNVPIYGDWTGTPLGANRKFNALPSVSILQRLSPSSDLSGIGQYLLDNVTYSDSVEDWYQFLWYGNGITPKNPSLLPLSHVAAGNGLATSRSSWSSAADTVFMSVRLEGKAGVSHEGYDEGHLSLSRGADRLLVHANMKSASNLHNTVVFNGASHHFSNAALTTPAIDRKEEGTGYFYVSGDITNAWKRPQKADLASLFRRSVLHIRPGFMVVYDVTRSYSASGNLKEWYSQYGVDPAVDATAQTVSGTVGGSKVFAKTIYPLGGTYTKDNPATGYWRVKYAPVTTQEYDQFLHVIEATGSGNAQTSAVPIDGTGVRGVVIGGNTIAMFTKDQGGANATSIAYTLNTSLATTHYIADLTPGATYSLTVDSGTPTSKVASSAGLIVFTNTDAAPHNYVLTQNGAPPPPPPPTPITTNIISGSLTGSIQ